MKAVVFQAPGRVSVEDRPEPVIEAPGDAIVRVTMTAVCGSDLLAYTGRRPRQAGSGMGHEVCGVVTAVGDGVTRVKAGDRVVSPFSIACGGCFYCKQGSAQRLRDAPDLRPRAARRAGRVRARAQRRRHAGGHTRTACRTSRRCFSPTCCRACTRDCKRQASKPAPASPSSAAGQPGWQRCSLPARWAPGESSPSTTTRTASMPRRS